MVALEKNSLILRTTLVIILSFYLVVLQSTFAGYIIVWGQMAFDGAELAGNDFMAIAAGDSHSLALKKDGSIVGWGCNSRGQATPPPGNDYVAIAGGWEHSLALKQDGSIVCWGDNEYGQAKPPRRGNDYVAIAAGSNHSLALKQDGSIVGWGADDNGQATPPAGNDFVAITAGWWHSLALKRDGSIVGWGDWEYDKDLPPEGNDYVAIAAGENHSLALKRDGSIVGWGAGIEDLGEYPHFGQAKPPAGIGFKAIAATFNENVSFAIAGCKRYAPDGDLYVDCRVDYLDLEIMARDWLSSEAGFAADINTDGIVDFKDYAILADKWLE